MLVIRTNKLRNPRRIPSLHILYTFSYFPINNYCLLENTICIGIEERTQSSRPCRTETVCGWAYFHVCMQVAVLSLLPSLILSLLFLYYTT